MKNIIIALVFIISPFLSFGHNPLSAKYHLEAGEKVSLLTINLSQDGVNQVLLKAYSEKELEALSQNEFKALIVNYIKSNFSLSFDKKEIKLKEGGVKLGSHQTDLKFVLPPVSSEVEQIEIHIPAFKENDNHQTIFSYKTNRKADYEILSSKNNYQSTIMLLTPAKSKNWFWFNLVGATGIILILLFKMSFSRKELSYSILKD